MEITDILVMNSFEQIEYIPLIIPTVLIPFTMVSVGISVVATFIAGLFGVKLKAEGPRQLLEVLLKPRILISALVLNAVSIGGYKAYEHIKNLPAFMSTVTRNHNAVKSDRVYTDLLFRKNFASSNYSAQPAGKLKEIWTKKLKRGSFRGPTLSANSLFFATDKNFVYEIDKDSSKTLRSFYLGTSATPAPIIHEGFLYTGEGTHHTHGARIYKIDLKSGKHIAQYTTGGHTEGQPYIATHEGRTLLFAVAGKDGIHAIDPKTMKLVWKANPGHIDATVRVEGRFVYIGTGREKGDTKKHRAYAMAYDFLTGEVLWKNELQASSWMQPALTNKYVCFITGEIYFKSKISGLNCYSKISGKPVVSILSDSALIGIPLVLDNDIIYSDIKGRLCRVDTKTFKKKWCYNTNSEQKNLTSPSYNHYANVIIYPTADKGLFVISPKTGNLVQRYLPKDKAWKFTYASALNDGKYIYIIDVNGLVRKLSF